LSLFGITLSDFLLVFWTVIGLVLIVVPLGIWGGVARTNSLLVEQNLRLYQLTLAMGHGQTPATESLVRDAARKVGWWKWFQP